MPEPVKLSKRLLSVAEMVSAGSIACDVGCDHGFVSIYLIEQQICRKVIAMDVRKGPLSAAGMHIAQRGLFGYIETRLSDGMAQLSLGEADTLICAGMGGRLMIKILTADQEKADAMREVILQPQSEIEKLRLFLKENKYWIADEDMVFEDGKYYPVIRAVPAKAAGDPAQYKTPLRNKVLPELLDEYGEILLWKKHPLLLRLLQFEYDNLHTIVKQMEVPDHKNDRIRKRCDQLRIKLQNIHDLMTQIYGIEPGTM